MNSILVTGICLLFVCLGIFIRNGQVCKFELEQVERVANAARHDIKCSKPWRWRYDELNSVSYGYKLLCIWKPLTISGFYTLDPARPDYKGAGKRA